MRWTRPILIALLLLTSAGCARRDWVGDLLVLTDVTGTWEGTVMVRGGLQPVGGVRAPATLVLQQTGPKVTGEFSWSRGQGGWTG